MRAPFHRARMDDTADPAALARLPLDLDLPEECRAGVTANLALLAHHRRIVGDEGE